MGEVDQLRLENEKFLQRLQQQGASGGATTSTGNRPQVNTPPSESVERSLPLDVAGQALSGMTLRKIREQIGTVPGFQGLPKDQQVQMVETMLKRSRAAPFKERELAEQLVQEGGTEALGIGKTGKALLLPVMAGAATGGASRVVQAGVDVAATAANMLLGYEPFSVTQLVLSAGIPLGFRGVARKGKNLLQSSKAMAFAKQEAQKRAAGVITANLESMRRQFNMDVGPMRETIKGATQEAKDFIEVQGRKGLVLHRQMVKSIPIQTEAMVDDLYKTARSLNPDIDITELRDVQRAMADDLGEVREVFSKMNDPLLVRLSGQPHTGGSQLEQLSNQFGDSFTNAPPNIQQQIVEQFGGDFTEDLNNVVSYSSVVKSLRWLGEMARSLSRSVVATPGAATDLRQVLEARQALLNSLDDAAKNDTVSQEARNALKLANMAFFKRETMKEFHSFSSQFIKPVTEGAMAGRSEMIETQRMLDTLFNSRNMEAVELVQRLRKLELLGGVKRVLGRIKTFQDAASRNVARLGRQSQTLDTAEARLRQVQTRGQEVAARMTPPLSGEALTPPDLQTPIRLTFGLASMGALGLSSATDLSPGQAFSITMPIGAGFVTPIILSGALMTKTGQAFMLRQLANSGGVVTENVAGAMGSFFRAVVPQVMSDEAQPPELAPTSP